MSSALPSRWRSEHRQSPFFRDLASPFSAAGRRVAGDSAVAGGGRRFATPGQAAAVSALWRENFASSDPPPPPVFTLEDRVNFSPETGLSSPSSPPPEPLNLVAPSTPAAAPDQAHFSSPSPGNPGKGAALQAVPQQSPESSVWWLPAKSTGGGEREEKAKGSPVDGVVQPMALITLPPPREVARPDLQRSSVPVAGLDEEEWITVYGFSPGDTNLVLREFEKCGVILKHIPGPRDANWMHILYQSRYDAQKALAKHGTQLNSVLIIGVKPVDPQQRRYLDGSLNSNYHGGFMVSLPSHSAGGRSTTSQGAIVSSHQPHYLQNGSAVANRSDCRLTGAIASPTKSVVSKVMDLMFGI